MTRGAATRAPLPAETVFVRRSPLAGVAHTYSDCVTLRGERPRLVGSLEDRSRLRLCSACIDRTIREAGRARN